MTAYLKEIPMLHRQRGAFNLYWVAILSAGLAALAMAALFSMRQERNLFAEGAARLGKIVSDSAVAAPLDSAKAALAGQGGQMRKCVIGGKTVISNTDCVDQNPTSKVIKMRDTRGFEAPKQPPQAKIELDANAVREKLIEKQLQ